MKRFALVAGCSVLMALAAALAESGGGAAAGAGGAGEAGGKKPATTAELGGPERYLTALATDKPIYRANEKVYLRAILLNAATHQPLGEPAQAEVRILGPKGDVVGSGGAVSQNSVVGFEWTVPEGAAGGEYTTRIAYPSQGYAPAERKFDVRIYRAPRLKSQITFVREGYGPGDRVSATAHVERAEGGIPAGAKVTVTARVDEVQVFTGTATIDAQGNCATGFDLPKSMERGEGTLSFAIEDGGTVETAAKTIPILLQTVDVAFYPEGGDPIVGIPNRFYVEARTPAKKPADLAGEILDSRGHKVADVKTEHEGRGRFSFVPAKGEIYVLKVTEPAGIKKTFALPMASETWATLSTRGHDVFGPTEDLALTLAAPAAQEVKVTVARREVEVGSKTVKLAAGESVPVSFALPPEVDGVLIVTVWDRLGSPLAERLVYRQPAHRIDVRVAADQSSYTPGGKATVNITTTDETGKPVAAVVGLTVTDDSVLEMVEKREQAPRLPAMVLLEPEVRELADAHVYLEPGDAKAALATDLLLGTQGWRRFARVNTTEFLNRYGDDAARVLALVKPQPPVVIVAPMGAGAGIRRELADDRWKIVVDGPPEMAKPAGAAEKAEAVGPRAAGQKQMAFAEMRPMADRDLRSDFVMVREYAHALRPGWTAESRSDFAETLYWNAGIQTDASGHATASFALADSVTTFRILADSFEKSGALGSGSASFQSVQPFFIEPKVPLEVTAGDVIELPVTAVNNTGGALTDLALKLEAGEGIRIVDSPGGHELPGRTRMRQVFGLQVGEISKDVDLTLAASAGGFKDRVTRKLRVRPRGFPTQIAGGGLLDSATPVMREFEIPASVAPQSLRAAVTVYPSPVANLTEAVQALMREPSGCFEQTSSTNYPLAMAQQYFTTHQGVDPKLVAQNGELLARGYQRLIGFECKEKGYEWFGTGPGHEALTAYGVMEFRDMQAAKLAMVDPQMIDRTVGWLLSRRDGKGGFQRNQRALDSFGGAPELTTDAYIVWALLQSGEKGLEPEIAAVRKGAQASDDSYVLALAANVCELAGDSAGARGFLEKLARKQGQSGAVDGAVTSITRSGGEALAIETTSLAALAWMKEPAHAANVQRAIEYLANCCKGGRFGSTQSTLLALKAITAYDVAQAHPRAAGEVALLLDGRQVGEAARFTADTKEPLKFADIGASLSPGKHTVKLQMRDGSQMPCSIAVEFNSLTPASDPACRLELSTTLKDAQLAEGAVTEAQVKVTNRTEKDAATPVAIVGIPGGLEVRHDRLKELVKSGKIDAYEVDGREVVLYWRQLKAHASADVSLSLVAAVPGTYTAPASRAYEYYTDEAKQWVAGESVKITPAAAK